MQDHERLTRLRALGYQGKYHYLEEAFSRNRGFISAAEQDRLLNATVAIPGLGGVGGAHLVTLARTGVGRFHLADFDVFEPANLNRQYGAKVSHFGRPKLDVMISEALDVNPFLGIRKFSEGVTARNLDAFLEGVDLVVDGIDFFNFEVRRLVFNRARERGIHVITAGPLGFGAALLVFAPDRGMGFDAYFDLREGMSRTEQLIAFMVGLAPRAAHARYLDPRAVDLENQKGPSLGAGCESCAAAAAAEAVRILLGRKGLRPAPHYAQYDPFAGRFHRGYLPFGNRHPLQRLKRSLIKRRLARPLRLPGNRDFQTPRAAAVETGIPDAVLVYLLRAAVQAPSGDNCQPWRFRTAGDRIDLLLRPDADPSLFNVDQTASLIACGAALENLLIAASRYGLEGAVDYLPRYLSGTPGTLARIRLSRGTLEEDPLQRFIWERHTNRTPYTGGRLPKTVEHDLVSSCSKFPAMTMKFYDAPEDIRKIAGLVYRADQVRTTTRGLHEHLVRMIRFSEEEALRERDGFPLKNLEAGLGGELFLRITRRWAVMNACNRLGIARIVPLIAYRGIIQAPLVGLLKCPDTRPETLVEGGRALERLWLTATRLGLSFQPMTAITLFWMRWRMQRLDELGGRQARMLTSLWDAYHDIFDVAPASREGHVMLFRIGLGRPVTCRTFRRPIAACRLPSSAPKAVDPRPGTIVP